MVILVSDHRHAIMHYSAYFITIKLLCLICETKGIHDDGSATCIGKSWTRIVVTLLPPTHSECLVQQLTLVLKSYFFTFNDKHYIQVIMEQKREPSYANIFMGKLQQQIHNISLYRPLSLFRFINDIDMQMDNTEQEHICQKYCSQYWTIN